MFLFSEDKIKKFFAKSCDNAVTILFYDSMKEFMGDGTIDLDDAGAGVFKAELVDTNYTYAATHSKRADWSANALSTANGYTSPGQNLTSVVWSGASTVTWDATDMSWTAASGSIGPAKHCIVYDDTTTTTTQTDSPLVDVNFGQEETAGDGTDFKVVWNGSGIFTLT
jgi:hypothetical protein